MFNTIKVWYSRVIRSRTMWLAMLLAVLGAVQASFGLFAEVLTPEVYGIATMVVGVAVAVLRVLTTQSLAEK